MINLSYHPKSGTLFVYFANSKAKRGREAPHDAELIIKYSEEESVVGVELFGARWLPMPEWNRHPDKNLIPKQLQDEITKWIEAADYSEKLAAQ
jgi:uncharacterized protein YuzE